MKISKLFAAFVFVFVILTSTARTQALSSITVNSPSNGQTFSGNSFTVSGAAEANSTVIILRNGLTLAQTRSDGSGKWSVNLSDLPDGENTITARSIKNTGFGYFYSTPDGFTTMKINQLRLADNTVNPSAPFPLTDTNSHIALVPSPTGSLYYAVANFGGSVVPAKFDDVSPAQPVPITGSYPSNSGANVGTFSADGTKFYSPNMQLQSVSVINATTNAWIKDIDLGVAPVTAWRAPNGKIYINRDGGKIAVINPDNDTVEKTIDLGCASGDTAPATTFSQDAAYPYYFVGCVGNENKLLKYDLATDQLVKTFSTSFMATNGVLNADNSKLYMASSAAIQNNTSSGKMYIMDPETGEVTKQLTMTDGVIGLFYSPDLQHIYAGTPGPAFDKTGIDVVDMFTDTVEHINTNGTVMIVGANSKAVTLSGVNVSVVLGVKTATASGGGTLANTGALAVSVTLLAGLIIASSTYVYYDYRRHKKPLVVADSTVKYTLWHHVKVVTIPLMKYRLSFQFEARNSSDDLHKF